MGASTAAESESHTKTHNNLMCQCPNNLTIHFGGVLNCPALKPEVRFYYFLLLTIYPNQSLTAHLQAGLIR